MAILGGTSGWHGCIFTPNLLFKGFFFVLS